MTHELNTLVSALEVCHMTRELNTLVSALSLFRNLGSHHCAHFTERHCSVQQGRGTG